MKNRPAYAIESVDRALMLAALLQQEGSIRVVDVADLLDIAPSTAHRLLTMLVYRDFAEQLPDRSYGPGPVLRSAERSTEVVTLLRRLGPPQLQKLVDRVGESANLMVRVGTEVRFVCTVECDRALRVGDRAGRSLPAHLSSGGRALLAALRPNDLADLYAGSEVDVVELSRRLDRARSDGFAVNREETEDGVTAVGLAVGGTGTTPVCAISVGLPTSRFDEAELPSLTSALRATRRAIQADLRGHWLAEPDQREP